MKITIDRELLEKAIESMDGVHAGEHHGGIEESIAAIRGALDQPQQELVALVTAAQKVMDEFGTSSDGLQELYQALKLYTSPPARKPLTDERLWKIWNSQGDDAMEQQAAINFARAIEAAHGIKDTPC